MYKHFDTKHTGTCVIKTALTEAYRRINPRQQVPSLMLQNETTMTEGPAMLLHMAEAHPEVGLAPPPVSSKRSQHDRG